MQINAILLIQQNKLCEQKEFRIELIIIVMENRHTTEIRELLEKKRLSKSRFNPESRVAVNPSSMKQSREAKKSASASNFYTDKQKQLEIQIMEKRYQELYSEYGKMVEQAKKRADMCRKQQEEILKYEKAGERDKKQIQRLKSMVGMISKQENGVQTTQSIENKSYFTPNTNMVSSISKEYHFMYQDPNEYSQEKITPKLIESKSYKDLTSKDLSPINSKNNRLTSENDESYKFNIMSNPMISSKMMGQSRNMSNNQSRNSLSKRNSSGFKDQSSMIRAKDTHYNMMVQSEKQLIKRFEQHNNVKIGKGHSSNELSHKSINDKSVRMNQTNEKCTTLFNNNSNQQAKMCQSFLYGGNKTSVDFRRKKNGGQKQTSYMVQNEESKESNQLSGGMNQENSNNKKGQTQTQTRISKMSNSRAKQVRGQSPQIRGNSPNMRYKFIPSVDL